MTWRGIIAILAALWILGCGETTVRPFVDKSDAGLDAGEDDAGEDDDELDGEDDDELEGGEEDGGQ